jgi:hypothetical protein
MKDVLEEYLLLQKEDEKKVTIVSFWVEGKISTLKVNEITEKLCIGFTFTDKVLLKACGDPARFRVFMSDVYRQSPELA